MFEIRIGDETVRAELHSPAVVGSHEGADLSLADPEGINRRHALLVLGVGGWTVYDLGANSGTRVNGAKVSRADLRPGDEIRIGKATLTLLADGNPDDPEARLDHLAAELLANSDLATVFAERCRVKVHHRDEWILDATFDDSATLGYSARCGLRLPHDGVSSVHALLARDGGFWQLYDLRSDEGLVHLGKRVASLPLSHGDIVRAGNVRLHFELIHDPNTSSPELPAVADTPSAESHAAAQAAALPPAAAERERLGDQSMAIGNSAVAAEHYLAACELAPWALPLRRKLRLAHAVRHDPTEPPGFQWKVVRAQWRARRRLLAGRLEEALAAAEKGLARDPWNRGLAILQAAAFEAKGDLAGALWCLNFALQRAPGDAVLNALLGRLFRHLGVAKRAIKHFERAANAEPLDRGLRAELQAAMVDKTIGANRGGVR